MSAVFEKIEITVVTMSLVVGGIAGTLWLLKTLNSSLAACAAFTPYAPF